MTVLRSPMDARWIVPAIAALAMGCRGAAAPAPERPKVAVTTPPPAPPERSLAPAIVVRSQEELASTRHTIERAVSFDSMAVVLIPGLSPQALFVDATSGPITVDRRTGALVPADSPHLSRPQTLTLSVGSDEILVVFHATLTRDCPPTPFDPPRGFPSTPAFVLPPTLAIGVPREAAKLPLRWTVDMQTIDPMCPHLFRSLTVVGDRGS